MRERAKLWLRKEWHGLIFRFYRKTDHHYEGLMHDGLCHDLLDRLGAPQRSKGGLTLSVYGRLREYALTNHLIERDRPQ